MRLLYPWALVLLVPALAVVWLVARRGHRVVGVRQLRVATIVRSLGVGLLALALTLPLLVLGSNTRSVVLLLDRSASITSAARDNQDAYVARTVAAAGADDVTAVAVFGRDVRLDRALTTEPDPGPVRTIIDSAATDLGGALRAAAAVLPTEGSRRIVVLTDGVETVGSARAAAAELAALGIAVDFVRVETGLSSDVIVLGVDAPVTARVGDVVPVTVRLRSTVGGAGTVTFSADAEDLVVPVDLVPGTQDVTVTFPAEQAGVLRVGAEVAGPGDAVPQNDRGEALVRVLGPARVGVVEGRIGEGDDLVRALAAGGIGAESLTAVPAAAELLAYDALVLINVPAPQDRIAADLAAFVEDLGRGVVVVGGDQAFGLGGYQDTALEELLPVTSDPEDLIRRQPVAEVLVIDTSGSMAACHCDDTTNRNDFDTGGINKTDISRAGAGLAINALQPTDRVGLLAFTSGTRWALPLAEKPAGDAVAAALNTLSPQGDTEISVALREALDALRDAPEDIRHIVLFTDGWGDDADLLTVAQDIADAGITLSILGTGEGTGETLRRMASLGGGQFYPGRGPRIGPGSVRRGDVRGRAAARSRGIVPPCARGGLTGDGRADGSAPAPGVCADQGETDCDDPARDRARRSPARNVAARSRPGNDVGLGCHRALVGRLGDVGRLRRLLGSCDRRCASRRSRRTAVGTARRRSACDRLRRGCSPRRRGHRPDSRRGW